MAELIKVCCVRGQETEHYNQEDYNIAKGNVKEKHILQNISKDVQKH